LSKIGRTKELSVRELSYQTPFPDGVDILHCRHTTDSKLAEAVIHHVLDDFRYADNREWFQGDPEIFAHIIDITVSLIDNLPHVVESVVTSQLRSRIRKELTRAKTYHPDDAETNDAIPGSSNAGSQPSVVVINASGGTVNVNVELPGLPLVRKFVEAGILQSQGHGLKSRVATRELVTWAAENDFLDNIPKNVGDRKALLIEILGPIYDNHWVGTHWGNGHLTGWKNKQFRAQVRKEQGVKDPSESQNKDSQPSTSGQTTNQQKIPQLP
jgi:hypothetical protein